MLLAICSCKTKEHTCTYSMTKRGDGLTFRGFKISDVDTFYVRLFTPDNTFTNIISIDTINDTTIYIDTTTHVLYTKTNNLHNIYGIDGAYDVELFIPSVNITYQVHAVYSPNSTYETPDCRDRHFVVGPESVIIKKNGTVVPTKGELHDNNWLILHLDY
ncbi:MAG: hypothetical protein JWQ38_2934 [Flavipsychrobacter sp.]|nr:hypothetical protein [Flavipsychrobacter sp.]